MGNGQDYTKEQVIDALKKSGGYKTRAGKILGCTYHTILNYINRYPEINEVLKDIKETNNDIAEFVVSSVMANAAKKSTAKRADSITKDEIDTCFRYLKYQAKDRGYVDRQELTGKDGDPLIEGIDITLNVVEAKKEK